MTPTPLVTVLYEDSKRGREYPLHNLVMRMVEDDINGETWRVRQRVRDNPRGGVDNVLRDVREAALHAGPGRLFALVDRDRIVHHMNKNARPGETPVLHTMSDDQIAEAIRSTSNAPDRVCVFFVTPDLEGLIATVKSCQPTFSPEVLTPALQKKQPLIRDALLEEVGREAHRDLRGCIREAQSGIGALVLALVDALGSQTS